jgi:anaerobic dimethyl sulfoxide reductase subunit C (anchor subunit)
MTEPRAIEWPLVVFTVGLQLAAGIAIANAADRWISPDTAQAARIATVSIFPIVLVAMVMSVFHIGRPWATWRALANFGGSRLSNEIVICMVFAVLALLEGVLWSMNVGDSGVLHLVTALAGMGAVISSARIYTIPSQPVWNSNWVPGSFAGSTLLLGGVAANLFIGSQGKSRLLAELMIGGGAVVLLASTAAMVRVIGRVARARYAAPEAIPVLQARHWLMVSGLIVLGCLIPLIFVVVHANINSSIAGGVLILTLAGVTLGRALMYSRGTALSRF